MKKTYLLLFTFTFSLFTLFAQTTKPDIITTSGNYYSNAAVGSLSWTIGEPIIETYTDGSNILTQGFQQSSYSVTAVENVTPDVAKIKVFPNPFTSAFTISTDGAMQLRAVVTDMTGKIVNEKTITTSQTQINLGNLSDALYLLKVFDNTGQSIQTFKIEKLK